MGSEDNPMKKTLLLIPVIIFILVLIFIGKPTNSSKLKVIKIGARSLSVELAQTIPEITLGLGQRDALGSDGMLFVMPEKSIPTFWMKDMRFDLDFVWIDTDRVIDLTENVSAQRGDPEYKLRVYSPRLPATHVLEMNSGEVQKMGIKIGDSVRL